MTKVLVNNEASWLGTGYGIMGKEILSRFHNAGINLAELASYGSKENIPNPPPPWKVYLNEPDRHNPEEYQRYNSNPINAFGLWKWEDTCLDYQPTHCLAWTDYWMSNFQYESPLRDFYSLIQIPTVDAKPQQDNWVDLYTGCDAIFSYSEWGGEVLKKQGSGKINYCGVASPAPANEFQFIPNKRAHKAKFGINPDSIIIGFTARNQKRKLFPELYEVFARFLREGPKEITSKCFLYNNTSHPDIGWDLRNLIKEHGIGNKVLFTYVCKNCGFIFPNVFQDTQIFCRKCGQQSVVTTSTKHSIENKDLANITGLFDIYVQYALAEGFGIPVVESSAVGIPTMVVNYSAMEDFPKTLNSIPIKVLKLNKESETGRYFAVPDGDDFLKKLTQFLLLPEEVRANLGFKTAQLAKQNYSWDKTVNKLIKAIESTKPKLPWNHPPRYHTPNLNFPQGLTNEQFVKMALVQVLGRPDKLNSYFEATLLRDLNMGCQISNWGGAYYNELSAIGAHPTTVRDFNRETLVKILLDQRNNFNEWERRRWAKYG